LRLERAVRNGVTGHQNAYMRQLVTEAIARSRRGNRDSGDADESDGENDMEMFGGPIVVLPMSNHSATSHPISRSASSPSPSPSAIAEPSGKDSKEIKPSMGRTRGGGSAAELGADGSDENGLDSIGAVASPASSMNRTSSSYSASFNSSASVEFPASPAKTSIDSPMVTNASTQPQQHPAEVALMRFKEEKERLLALTQEKSQQQQQQHSSPTIKGRTSESFANMVDANDLHQLPASRQHIVSAAASLDAKLHELEVSLQVAGKSTAVNPCISDANEDSDNYDDDAYDEYADEGFDTSAMMAGEDDGWC
jgi:hypothetical protein